MMRVALGLLLTTASAFAAGDMMDERLTPAQRNDACYAVRGQRSPEVVATLKKAIHDPVVRACAARNLRAASAVEGLVEAVNTGAPDTRMAAARELGFMVDNRALAALGNMAMDPNSLVAASAIAALGAYTDRAALPYLLKAAAQPTVSGVTALQQAAHFRDPLVLPLVRDVIRNGDIASRVIALGIIGDLGDASDLPKLREIAANSEKVESRGRGFGFMPVIDVARVAQNAIDSISVNSVGLRPTPGR